MSDERDDDAISSPKATPATADEIAEYETAIRKLIHFRSPFDKQLRFLDEMLTEREKTDETPADDGPGG